MQWRCWGIWCLKGGEQWCVVSAGCACCVCDERLCVPREGGSSVGDEHHCGGVRWCVKWRGWRDVGEEGGGAVACCWWCWGVCCCGGLYVCWGLRVLVAAVPGTSIIVEVRGCCGGGVGTRCLGWLQAGLLRSEARLCATLRCVLLLLTRPLAYSCSTPLLQSLTPCSSFSFTFLTHSTDLQHAHHHPTHAGHVLQHAAAPSRLQTRP